MNKDIAYYRKIQNAYDCAEYNDMLRNETVDDINFSFKESLDVDKFQFVYTHDNDDIELEIHRINWNSSNIVQQKFKSKINAPVIRGEVLYNYKQNLNWLCVDSRPIDYLYYDGMLRQCDYHLRWQDEDRNIINRWCCISTASQYNSGEIEDKNLTIGYNQLAVYLPLDEDTVKLKSDKRFFIDSNKVNPKPYRLTRVDTVTMAYDGVGCVVLIVTECQYNPETDSVEEFICDYIPKVNTQIEIDYFGKDYGDAEIGINSKKTFTANTDKTVIDWNIINYTGTDIQLDIDSINPNKCKVLIKENYDLIGQEFILECIDEDENIGNVRFKIGGEL